MAREPLRFDDDPVEWARQLLRILNDEPPTRPLLVSHFDMWEMDEAESGTRWQTIDDQPG